mgnify:CR=1 FL=1
MADKNDAAAFADKEKVAVHSTSVSGSASVNSEEGHVDAEGYGSTDSHIFSDPTVAEYWRNVYEKAGYENRHRFDPSFTWTAEEERKLVRKIDIRIVLW